jgi:hypothetical protein
MNYTIEEYEFRGELYTLELEIDYDLKYGEIESLAYHVKGITGPSGKIENTAAITEDLESRFEEFRRWSNSHGSMHYLSASGDQREYVGRWLCRRHGSWGSKTERTRNSV